MEGSRPPAEIKGSSVMVRRHAPQDAAALHEAILESVEHLRPWMPWAAAEPLRLSDRRALITGWVERWDAGVDFSFAIVQSGTLVGGGGLSRRVGPSGLAIGYWTRAGATRRGVATDAARCLVEGAFAMPEIEFVEIRHDSANLASGRVPLRLGFNFVQELQVEPTAPGQAGFDRVWRLERDAWQAPSPAPAGASS